MAARLTVIISQSAIRDSRVSDAEETLLAELMMTTGLDATLVGALETMETDSTDFLCLSSFSQQIALVSSLSRVEVAQQWQRLGLDGQVVTVGEKAVTAARRVVHFSLSVGPPQIIAQLKQLLADRSVQTVNLLLPNSLLQSTSGQSKSTSSQSTSSQQPTTARPAVGSPSRAAPVKQSRLEGQPIAEEDWVDLDQLVDDFESLDL